MPKELVINQTLNECRAALIENGEILDYLMERGNEESKSRPSVGNIYKARVLRVLPGMQSAFLDIGYEEKAAFLYVDDAYLPSIEEQREMAKKSQEAFESRPGETIPDELSTLAETVDMRFRPKNPIEDFLKEGEEILVQIAKEPISKKGPRVTKLLTLAGRYVVFMPYIEHIGVSRRIENEGERERLKDILEKIRPDGRGIIARTVAEGQSAKTIRSDYNMLVKIWREILKKSEKAKAPSLIYRDLTFIQKVLRDITDEDVSQIIVDDKENFKEVEKFLSKYLPTIKGKIKKLALA